MPQTRRIAAQTVCHFLITQICSLEYLSILQMHTKQTISALVIGCFA